MSNVKRMTRRLPQTGALYAIVLLMLYMGFSSSQFMTVSNLMNIVRQASITCIIAICSFLAVLTKQTDLSVGAVAGVTAVVTAMAYNAGLPIGIACLLALLVGALFGVLNGVLIGYTRIAPFVITLGTQSIASSLGVVLSSGHTLPLESPFITYLGKYNLWVIPVPAIITAGFYLLFAYVLKSRPYGTKLYAVGGNAEAALASGIAVRKIKFSVFLINGVLATCAGFILAARLGSANALQGMGLELDGICSAVLGGAALSGGKGSIWGALLGALAISILRNGLNILGVTSAVQMGIIGSIMVLILAVDTVRSKD